jgi:hypothetical protein
MLAAVQRSDPAAQRREDRVFAISLGEGLKYGLASGAAVGAGTVVAHFKHAKFGAIKNLSVKTAIPLMAGLFVFSLKFEKVMYDCNRNPGKWGLAEYVEKGVVTNMPFHHRVANAVYDHPYYLIAATGLPLAGTILSKQLEMKNLTLSQKIMHTRVFAQAGVLTLLLTTMGFREYMHKHGRFEEPDDEAN